MRSIARFIARYHAAIFGVFVALACICLVAMTHVETEHDLSQYLPESFQMSQGREIMAEEFGDSALYNVMCKDVPQDERAKLADAFAGIDGVSSVSYDEDDPANNNGEYALYAVNADVNSYADDASGFVYAIRGLCESRGYECWIDNEAMNSSGNLGPVLVVAVLIAMVILFVLASSWIEPLLLLFTILVAVAINMGTNIFFGKISETTGAIAAILQMALSMDYLIMLLNRYRREHVDGVPALQAMENAVVGGIRTIASSSVTTIVGLLCLALMSFQIGRDLGVVLAKGVFLSLVCAFGVLPALVLWLEDAMARTAKPTIDPQMKGLAAFSYRFRGIIAVVFAVLLVGGFALRGLTTVTFVVEPESSDHAQIVEQFSLDSQVVVLYGNEDARKMSGLEKSIKRMPGVVDLSSYASSIGKQRSVASMAHDNDMDEGLVRLLYYRHFEGSPKEAVSASELAAYLRGGMQDDLGSDYIDSDMQDKLDTLAGLVEDELGAGTYTCSQAANALSSHASIHPETLELIYLALFSGEQSDPSWTMSTHELMDFLVDDVLEDPVFDDVLDRKARSGIRDAHDAVEDARGVFTGPSHSRTMLSVSFGAGSDEMRSFVGQLRTLLDENGMQGSYYLIGRGPMVDEMAASFDSEFNFLSIITILAIFLIVAITFRSPLVAVVLVAVIQTAFSWDMVICGLTGQDIYYVALFCVQSILMGATIDYAILFTNSYREARAVQGVREALASAYRNSIRTICMSGSILVFVCLCLGLAVTGITGQICMVISEGAAAAVILVLFALPATLAALDRLTAGKHAVRSIDTGADKEES